MRERKFYWQEIKASFYVIVWAAAFRPFADYVLAEVYGDQHFVVDIVFGFLGHFLMVFAWVLLRFG